MEGITYWHFSDTACTADFIPFFNISVVTKDNGCHTAFLQIHGNTHNLVRELKKLIILGGCQSVNPGDTITNFNHSADIDHGRCHTKLLNLLLDDRNNIFPSCCHFYLLITSFLRSSPSSKHLIDCGCCHPVTYHRF